MALISLAGCDSVGFGACTTLTLWLECINTISTDLTKSFSGVAQDIRAIICVTDGCSYSNHKIHRMVSEMCFESD